MAARPVDFDPFVPLSARELRLPLTEAQGEMWVAAAMGREANCSYNQCFALTLEGPLRIASLRAAVNRVVERHAALRVVVSTDATSQTVQPPFTVEVPLVDLSDRLADAQRQEIEALLAIECDTPFDLSAGPLVRAFVVRQTEARHVFVFTAHHIVCDGWSSSIVFANLGRFYVADSVGLPAQPPPSASYEDYVAAETGPQALIAAGRDQAYWADQYADGAPVLDLPLGGRRPPVKSYRSGEVQIQIGPELYRGIKRVGAKAGATLFATLLAGFEVLLHRLSGQTDFVIGIPLAGQLALDNPRLVAHAVNTIPLRARLDSSQSFLDHVRGVKKRLADGQDHARLTFGSLVRELRIPRDPSRTPLVALTFNIDKVGAPFDFGEVAICAVATPKAYLNFELAVNVVDTGAELRVECAHNRDLFDAATIRRWLRHYDALLHGVVERPDQALDALPLLDEDDKRTILDEWNETGVDFPDEKRLHRLFEAQARRTPDATAVVDGTTRVRYGALNGRANRLAHHLRRLGVGPEVAVGVCLERGAGLIAALLAVLKAGGAYIPLDPAYPRDRVAFMLKDSQARAVVTQAEFAADLRGSAAQTVLVDADSNEIASHSPADLPGGAEAGNLAYVIYTSGSTGVPKGVAIEHRSAGTLVHWARTVFSDRDLSALLASTSVCFDLSIFEIFFPLAFGGRIILAQNALELSMLPARDEVTLVNTVPSAAAELVRSGGLPRSVETVCLAGEPLSTRLVDQLYATGHVKRVYDLYGPSEDTTYSTFALRQAGAPPTIGRPIANTRAYVLDARREPVPIGVVGELYLAGDGLARGYLHRDALTAERFVTGPFGGRTVERAYRTGDLVRHRADGTLEFLGRSDHQVKIRGFRIELGEIEQALVRSGLVADASVVEREDRPGDKYLAAYVVPADLDAPGLAEALKARLRTALPEFMVPGHIVTLAALPLTPNGKVDRKALPAPDPSLVATGTAYIAPRTATESRIAAIWSEALGIEAPGVEHDFFDLGGHSLKAAQIVTAIRSALGVDLAMRHLFERPTIAGLAGIVDLLGVTAAPGRPTRESAAREEIEI